MKASLSPVSTEESSETRPFGVVAAWVALCVIWSSTWLAIKIGLSDLPPLSFGAIRFIISAIILFAICYRRYPILPRTLSDYYFLAVTGLLTFGLNYGTVFWGEQHVSSGLAAVLQATIPCFGLVFAHFYLPGEKIRWERALGALLALGGVAIICARVLQFEGTMPLLGGLAIVIGAAGVAYANVIIKARPPRFAPAALAAWQMVFGLIPLLGLGLWLEGNPLHFHWNGVAIACLLYLALVGSVLAFLLFYWLMPRIPVTNLLTISLITPPAAIGLGWLFGGEAFSLWALVGAALVLIGVKLILTRTTKRVAKNNAGVTESRDQEPICNEA